MLVELLLEGALTITLTAVGAVAILALLIGVLEAVAKAIKKEKV